MLDQAAGAARRRSPRARTRRRARRAPGRAGGVTAKRSVVLLVRRRRSATGDARPARRASRRAARGARPADRAGSCRAARARARPRAVRVGEEQTPAARGCTVTGGTTARSRVALALHRVGPAVDDRPSKVESLPARAARRRPRQRRRVLGRADRASGRRPRRAAPVAASPASTAALYGGRSADERHASRTLGQRLRSSADAVTRPAASARSTWPGAAGRSRRGDSVSRTRRAVERRRRDLDRAARRVAVGVGGDRLEPQARARADHLEQLAALDRDPTDRAGQASRARRSASSSAGTLAAGSLGPEYARSRLRQQLADRLAARARAPRSGRRRRTGRSWRGSPGHELEVVRERCRGARPSPEALALVHAAALARDLGVRRARAAGCRRRGRP